MPWAPTPAAAPKRVPGEHFHRLPGLIPDPPQVIMGLARHQAPLAPSRLGPDLVSLIMIFPQEDLPDRFMTGVRFFFCHGSICYFMKFLREKGEPGGD
jgi:hypothetical protein